MNAPDPLDNPYAAPRVTEAVVSGGPTDYDLVPWYRRNGYCSAMVGTHAIVMLFGGCVPGLALLGIATMLGVIGVCITVLTGPVYYNQKLPDGTLKTWSKANKVAAVIVLLLFSAAYVGLALLVLGNL